LPHEKIILKNIGILIDRKPKIILFILLILFFIQSYTCSFQNSVTADEFAHLPAGLLYWKTGDFKIYYQNPPLIKLLASFPLLFSPAELPNNFRGRWGLGYGFMVKNKDIYHLLFVLGRTVIILLSLLMAWLLFRFAAETLGIKAALFSVFLFTFSPNILAHSYLVTTDIGASLGILAALYTLWRYLNNPSPKMLLLCGMVFGFAQLTKFSSLILVPAFPILMILNYFFGIRKLNLSKMIQAILIVFFVGMLIINSCYLFHGSFKASCEYSFRSSFFSSLASFTPEWLPLPFPKDYLLGLDAQKYESDRRPVPVYLFGELSSRGWWHYFLFAFFLKTPIPILILLLWIIMKYIYNLSKRKKDFFFLYVLTFIAMYMLFFSSSVINLGIRYILPIYPLIFLLSGYVIKEIKLKGKILLFALSAWLIINTIFIYPHHLSFFNEFAGGPNNGYKYLADSNIDWGQDLISLKRYLLKNEIDFVYLSHFGLVEPEVYGIKYKPLPPYPIKGTIAISVNHLLGISAWKKTGESFSWLRAFEPDDHAGYSILIYKL
jgi:4-amino-4-deoxy-L-arabinose transferase-like glycosyltransferase